MALLDMARKQIKYIEVAHVNYHKRQTAIRDEKIVRNYCKKYNIKFNLLNLKPEDVKGNFQACARVERYAYFNKVCEKHNLDAVLVAHQKDDFIETYLMQLDKKLGVDNYGLAYMNNIYGAKVIRPLLDFTKADLIKYCEDNSIEYGIDESNNTNHYERNRVRHSRVDKMSIKEKNKLVAQANKKNDTAHKQRLKALSHLSKKEDYDVDEFLNIPYLAAGLRVLLGDNSDKFYEEMLRQIKESKKYLYEGEMCWLTKEYNQVHLFFRPISYEYKFKNIKELNKIDCMYFKLRKSGKSTEGVTLSSKDFPITIRNFRQGDEIKMLYGTKKLNRFMIDNKVLIKDRETYPVMINRNNKVILVPNIGCDVNHYSKKHNVYMIKY